MSPVELARRFFIGRIEPDKMLPAMREFGRMYEHRPTLTVLEREVAGLRTRTWPEALIFGCGELLRGWTLMKCLSEMTVPTLVLAGRHDFQYPREYQTELASGLPQADLRIIDGAGQNAPSEQPFAMMDEIKHFLERYDPGSTQSFAGADLSTT